MGLEFVTLLPGLNDAQLEWFKTLLPGLNDDQLEWFKTLLPGLNDAQLEWLGSEESVIKTSRRDLPYVISQVHVN